MKAKLDDGAAAALKLPADDKTVLAEKIAQRLVSEVPPEMKRKQLAELMSRREEILSGKPQGVSLAQAIREIQALVP
jgi:hypothetical protein